MELSLVHNDAINQSLEKNGIMQPPDGLTSPAAKTPKAKSSNKRKSCEGTENDENKPNTPKQTEDVTTSVAKKLKFKEALVNTNYNVGSTAEVSKTNVPNGTASKPKTTGNGMNLRSKSALPRYSQARRSVLKTSSSTPSGKESVKPREPASADRSKKSKATPSKPKSETSSNAMTPTASVLRPRSPIPMAPPEEARTPNTRKNQLLKRLNKVVSSVSATDVMRGFFDSAFSVSEDDVTTIVQNLKVKSRWDFKEKARKQEAVVKELRSAVTTLLTEIKGLRENCLLHENNTTNLLRDCHDEVFDAYQRMQTFRITENNLKHELTRVQNELNSANVQLLQLKATHSPLRNRNKDVEHQLADVQKNLQTESSKRVEAEKELEKVKKELLVLQVESEANMRSLKDQHELRVEQAISGYRDEVMTLRNDLNKRQDDSHRYNSERADIDKKTAELHEEKVLAQSMLREAENTIQRMEKDSERARMELEQMKEQLALKDNDLRSAMNSLQDMQKQNCDEKSGLRSELSVMQSRLQAIEEERLALTADLAARKEELLASARDLQQARDSVAQLDAKLIVKDSELTTSKDSHLQLQIEKELRAKSEIREESERRERIAAVSQLLATQTDCNHRLKEAEERNQQNDSKSRELVEQLKKECSEAHEKTEKMADKVMGLEKEVQQLHLALEDASANHEAVDQLSRVTGELEIARHRLKEMAEQKMQMVTLDAQKVAEYEEKIREGETQRRKLHNLIQELRGNVRVFARIRPFLPNDGLDMANLPDPTISTRPTDPNNLKIVKKDPNSGEELDHSSFSFDRVFGPSVSQEILFQEVSEFVQSALDGYNVCLFSYGQTGSGKTHTMQGSGSGSMRGVIPRAVQQVGQYKSALEEKGWNYQMEVSFIEIYNETIKDLLRNAGQKDNSVLSMEGGKAGNNNEELKHEIKRDASGRVYITDVSMLSVDPNDSQQIDDIMETAACMRSVGQTAMNERSSRSHSVFTLHLTATHAVQGTVLRGTLSLVDLAGSERLDRSGATGSVMKESVAINKSLSALADVFTAIGNKQSHIPFRNSKLTYLLQPALSGDGKTLMMVNLSPTDASYHESLCSLRLAKQVNQCELGKPKRNLKEALMDKPAESNSGKSSASTPSRKMNPNTSLATIGEASASKTTAKKTQRSVTPTTTGTVTRTRKTPVSGSAALGGARKVARK